MKRVKLLLFLVVCFTICLRSNTSYICAGEHVHNDNCYNGVKHTHTGNSSSGGGCHGQYMAGHSHTSGCYTNTYCSGIWSGTLYVSYYLDSAPCPDGCGGYTGGGSSSSSTMNVSCNKCGKSFTKSCYEVSQTWNGSCSGCGSVYTGSTNYSGSTHGTISSLNCGLSTSSYYTVNCGKTAGAYYNDTEEVLPLCDDIVVSIFMPAQEIYFGGDVPGTAVATYLNGSTKIVSCDSSGVDATILGEQTCTLTYNGLVGNAVTTGTCDTSFTVTVLDYITDIAAVQGVQDVYCGSDSMNTDISICKASTGDYETVSATSVMGFDSSIIGNQEVTLLYDGLTDASGSLQQCTVDVLIKPNVVDLKVTPENPTVPYGSDAKFMVEVYYEDDTTADVTHSAICIEPYAKTKAGLQTVTFQYEENSITVSATADIKVLPAPITESIVAKPNIIGLKVILSTDTILYGQAVSFAAIVYFKDGSSKEVVPTMEQAFDSKKLGKQDIKFSYTEAGITVNDMVCVTVTDYITDIQAIEPVQHILYGKDINPGIKIKKASTGNKEYRIDNPVIKGFDSLIPGEQAVQLIYQDELKTVKGSIPQTSISVTVSKEESEEKESYINRLHRIVPTKSNQIINYGSNPDLTVIAYYEDGSERHIAAPANNFDSGVVGTQMVTLSWTENGVTKTTSCMITIVENEIIVEDAINTSASDAQEDKASQNTHKGETKGAAETDKVSSDTSEEQVEPFIINISVPANLLSIVYMDNAKAIKPASVRNYIDNISLDIGTIVNTSDNYHVLKNNEHMNTVSNAIGENYAAQMKLVYFECLEEGLENYFKIIWSISVLN